MVVELLVDANVDADLLLVEVKVEVDVDIDVDEVVVDVDVDTVEYCVVIFSVGCWLIIALVVNLIDGEDIASIYLFP